MGAHVHGPYTSPNRNHTAIGHRPSFRGHSTYRPEGGCPAAGGQTHLTGYGSVCSYSYATYVMTASTFSRSGGALPALTVCVCNLMWLYIPFVGGAGALFKLL